MTVALVALATFLATLIGGLCALTFRDKLHLILGFSAGAVAGVALFDLLPEALELGEAYYDIGSIALFVALGFFGYLVLDRLVLLHTHEEEGHSHETRGALGALTLSAHSFLDGLAIGIGFQASTALGIVVAIAVLVHDFSDGINTVNYVLRNGGEWKKAFKWLLVDAVAPVLGVLATLLFTVPESALGPILAVFTGTFLYLSASDLIPESHHRHPRALTTVMTLAGAAVLYGVIKIAG